MLFSPRGDYKNFKFRAELKINDKGNSGMYVRTAKKASFTDGYEIQVNSTHSDPIKTGSLYTLVHLMKSPAPPDTYFTQEIEVADINYRGKVVTRFRISVNGELLYEYLDHDRLFKEGHFAFQQHDPGSKVSIRKVEVMELPATRSDRAHAPARRPSDLARRGEPRSHPRRPQTPPHPPARLATLPPRPRLEGRPPKPKGPVPPSIRRSFTRSIPFVRVGGLARDEPTVRQETPEHAPERGGGGAARLKRVLGPVGLTSLGVGAIIGTGIFVLTGVAAHDKAGPA